MVLQQKEGGEEGAEEEVGPSLLWREGQWHWRRASARRGVQEVTVWVPPPLRGVVGVAATFPLLDRVCRSLQRVLLM